MQAAIVAQQTSTLVQLFTFDAPLLTQSGPSNAPTSGGAAITFRGNNFGSVNFSPTAGVSTTPCATTSWISDSMATCRASPGFGKVLSTMLTLGGIVGTAMMQFSFSTPVVTAHDTPNAPPIMNSATITVYGLNFAVADATLLAYAKPNAPLPTILCPPSQTAHEACLVCL
jgi:hypothetical protein